MPPLSARLWFTLLVAVYLAVIVWIGLLARRGNRTSVQYLNATRSLPLWCSTLAFIAANCGALDVVALMALGAQYGALAFHFYWIGAIPALIVLALWLLPAYRLSRAVTIFEFVGRHYGKPTRTLVALSMSLVMTMLTGIGLYAVSQVLLVYLGWSFLSGLLITAAVLLACSWNGGLRATIYSEILHFSIVLAAVGPLLFVVLHAAGGPAALMHDLPSSRIHAWRNLHLFAPRDAMDIFGLVGGLGVVLSFGYWGTDFVLMQRALSVKGESNAQTVPLAAALAKLGFAMLIVVPGIAAPFLLASPIERFDRTLPTLILHFYPGLLADLGILGVLAALMVNLSANLSAVAAMWTYDVYQAAVRPGLPDAHYLKTGRVANAAAIALAVLGAFTALRYRSLMEYIQLLLATVNAPLLGILASAFLMRGSSSAGGLWGFAFGFACAILHQALYRMGILHYGSQMAANFYGAMAAFAAALATAAIFGHLRKRDAPPMPALEAATLPSPTDIAWSAPVAILTVITVILFVLSNALFW